MIDRLRGAGSLLALLVAGTSCAWANGGPEWMPMPMDTIRAIYDSDTLSDEEIVEALALHLDKRISMARLQDPRGHRPGPGYEYGSLIGLMIGRRYPAKPPKRPESIEAVLNGLAARADVANQRELRSYLCLAHNLAGGAPTHPEVLGLLDDRRTPQDIVALALEAMTRSGVPIRSLPRLLELADHPWNLVYTVSSLSNDDIYTDVGPTKPKRFYPIRVRVPSCLRELSIVVKVSDVEDKEVDAQAGRKLTTTVVAVDRASLVGTLQVWLLDRRARVWQPAASVVRNIPGDDVKAMLADLLKSGLPREKREALHPERLPE